MTLSVPFIITNFKAYESANGETALNLAKIHEKVALETGVNFGIAVSAIDLKEIAGAVKIPVFSQHVDPIIFGAYTGHILSEGVKNAGAVGTLLNHSERRIPYEVLEASIKRAKEAGLTVIACAKDPEEAEMISKNYQPDFVAYEPPELIGGDISVSTAKPELIEDAVKRVGKGKLVVGAGVKNSQDVKIAFSLGAVGILLASGVTKAAEPEKVLKELAEGVRSNEAM